MTRRFASVVGILFFVMMSCDERLPEFRDPNTIFTGGIDGWYHLTSQDSGATFYVSLTNTYDETLEDTASISGTIVVQLLRDPSYRRTLSFNNSNIVVARGYNSSTGILRVEPQERILLEIRWDFFDDLGRFLPGEAFVMKSDALCQSRKVSNMESFGVRSETRVFRRVKEITASSMVFSLCYATPFIEASDCPAINAPTAACR